MGETLLSEARARACFMSEVVSESGEECVGV
jgi:hypothetical protein